MSAEENKELVRRQFELLSSGDSRGAAALWAPEAWNNGRKADNVSMEKVYRSLIALHETHTLHEMVAEGEWVAVRTTCSGVHDQDPEIPVNSAIFRNVKPTGRSYTNQHLHMFRVVNGRLAEHWANRDDLSVARQIGLELRSASD